MAGSEKIFPKSTRIMIVDDSPAMLTLLQNMLTNMGYLQIVRATDGRSALDKLLRSRTQGLPIELLICDWNMPKMSGIEVLRTIRSVSHWVGLPFIFVTALSEMSDVCEAIAAGADNYIVKPVDPNVLEKKLEAVYQKTISKKKAA